MKLAISLATRGRPQQLVNTIKRSIVNWTDPNTVMYVQADDDDRQTFDAIVSNFDGKIKIDSRAREDTIAAKWNRIMGQVPDADVYSIAADDDPYITPGYDSKILEAAKRFPDGIGMVYGHLANLTFTGSLSMTRKMAEILGYVQPEYFPFWFCDHWTDDLAKMIGRITFSDHRTDQSNVGQTQERRESAWWATFYDACYLIRHKEAQKLLDHPDFQCPEWQKDLLKSNWPLIDQRSRTLNSFVRQQQQFDLSLKDERYLRLKKAASQVAEQQLSEMPLDARNAFQPMLFPPTSAPALKRAYA